MCIIIVKQRNIEIPSEYLKNSSRINPHGLGVVWLDTFEISYHKSSEWSVLNTARPYIAHFRYATVGKVGPDNTHPFRCGANKHEYLMMNGTIHGLGNKDVCDTKVLAESLDSVPRHKWKAELEKNRLVRFVTINTRLRTFQLYNRDLWTFRNGVWYSKDNIFQDHVVAVYGTVLGKLDQLEGHPNWYCRKQITITMKKKEVTCWLYFAKDSMADEGDEMHESYEVGYIHHPFKKETTMRDLFLPAEKPTYKQVKFESFDDLYSNLSGIETEDDEPIIDEIPYCTSCYKDLANDGYGNYCCIGCNEWYTQAEVDNLL